MKRLEEEILKHGKVYPGGILKVDSFLNHQCDTLLLKDMAEELKRLYEGKTITKILTIEASGIPFATMVSYVFNVPMLFVKKGKTKNMASDVYTADIVSFTRGGTYTAMVSKEYLLSTDKVLFVDDFLASGSVLLGIKDICDQAGAELVGCGIAVEKVFQGGGNKLREQGFRVESLAKIREMTDDAVIFGD